MRRFKITKTTVLAASLLLLFAFSAGAFPAKEKHEEKFEKTMALAKDGKVHISNISGDIEVRGWGEAQVKIQALKVSKASSLGKAKENAEKVKIEITEEGNVLRIETKYPKSGKIWGGDSVDISVDYWLWIPDQASLKASSISGDVDAEGIGGSVDLSAISGDVNLRRANKGAECSTVSGDLGIMDVAGEVFLKSVSGDVTAKKIKGSIQAKTVSGEIELTEVSEANVVRGETLSGEIIYRGSINPTGNYSLKSHSGEVEMTLPAASAFDFEAETFSGSISTDFEVKVSGKISPREMRGVVNGGGASVKLSSFSGDISLKKI